MTAVPVYIQPQDDAAAPGARGHVCRCRVAAPAHSNSVRTSVECRACGGGGGGGGAGWETQGSYGWFASWGGWLGHSVARVKDTVGTLMVPVSPFDPGGDPPTQAHTREIARSRMHVRFNALSGVAQISARAQRNGQKR